MKLENQVIALEQAKRLKELGVIQESHYCYCYPKDTIAHKFEKVPDPKLIRSLGVYGFYSEYEYHSAFTVAELGVMLDRFYTALPSYDMDWWCQKWDDSDGIEDYMPPHDDYNNSKGYKTEAQARAAMLIHLVDMYNSLDPNNKFIEEVNERLKNA